VVQFIKEIIESRIRPVLNEDGGDVEFKKFDEQTGILILELQGACTGCPSSEVTLKGGIERMIVHYVSEVKAVHAFDQDSDDIEIVN
jgi:Fe-S cluster biogenesis protein NfuA